MKRIVALFCLIAVSFLPVLFVQAAEKDAKVYVIPIEGEVEKGLYAFLDRAIGEAEKNKAEVIIFDMHTPGGSVDAAVKIGNRMSDTKIKTVAYVDTWALSAGSYLALRSNEIYMAPSATMGASAIIEASTGNTAGEKAESMWLAEMEGAAMQSGRDPQIALAMATADIDLPDLKKNGKLLTLTSEKAEKVKYSEGTVKNLSALVKQLGYSESDVHQVELSFAEQLARFITNPIVVPILLSIASIGLVLELYSPGFGLPGGMGVSALLLFFYGHYVAGLAGYETLILFVLGVLLIAAEFFLAGGIAGTLGTLAVVGSLFLAGGNVAHMAVSVAVALLLAALSIIIMIKVFGKRMNIFKKLILTDSTNTESGYVSNVNRLDLIGRTGKTVTALRPSGTVVVDDERLDVVAEGRFIESDTDIKVVKVEGSRIVVREV